MHMSVADAQPSVLFVDDDRSILQGLARRMRKEPFHMHTAGSADEALMLLSHSSIDLVVSDMNMPGMTGMEFLARIAKERPECIRIMLTGRPTLDVAMGAINSGQVYRFLTKPYDAGALAGIIRDALGNRARHESTNSHVARKVNDEPDDASSPLDTHFHSEATGLCKEEWFKEFFARLERPNHEIKIQQYIVKGVIGKGAMGVVLRAHDAGLARDVALKVLTPALANCPVAHERFAMEARYAAAIRHENVVTIFAVSSFHGLPFLVMEYVPGKSLQDRLQEGERPDIDEIIRIGRQIASGLAAAHDLRLIHRDIKPANILLDKTTQSVRITDFGLARALDCDSSLSQDGLLLGTPLFMSPEQVDGKPLTPATDLFSVGSLLYTLCTGTYPFQSKPITKLLRSIVEAEPTPIQSLNPKVPDWLARVIQHLMAKAPGDRISSAATLADLLRKENAMTE
jgi:CheY-like chemotaxis protein